MYENTMSPADIAAVTGNNNGSGMFGGNDNNAWWIILFLLFGRNGYGYGGQQQGGGCGCAPCATQADVRAAVDQQTLISKLDQQTYGLADSTYALNNTIQNGFHGVDSAVCNLGYNIQTGFNTIGHQISDCCCATQGAIRDVGFGIERATLQNRYDAQAYNCNTLQAIDKVGDRIIDYLANEKAQALRDENFALRLSASQSAQNAYLIGQLREPCPVPAYFVPNPNCCYQPAFQSCGCNGGGF